MNSLLLKDMRLFYNLNPILDGLLTDGGGGWVAKMPPPPKICHTYPTMMKLGTVIAYLIQRIYESRDIPLEFL